ncbi:class I SAM-dependent methyltransferase [Capnocytophaga canimorsus]|uniref:class I SAM-dependent methyltransferase n=1 Tax=Capnocytophaga canimorsus TaxID=28188 RepID=UPI000D6E4B50|nr:class I SAM-dependent methyltransferase [Capnocytophaga canimorsus]AWL78615.1 class I SAM-dependent methyltransferase [Capnocytophaga canimorsus]
MDTEKLKILASQLKNPHGERGLEVAEMMYQTNLSMIQHALQYLDIEDGNTVLEIGYGNGKHISLLFEKTPSIFYQGLEISPLMHEQATIENQKQILNQSVNLQLYNGKHIPFSEAFFDRIFTVNTIYFWEFPELFLKELYRVLKLGGRLTISFIEESFMEKMPFTNFGFTYYNKNKINRLLKEIPFEMVDYQTEKENIKSKMGEWVEREFSTISLIKTKE